MKTFSFLLLLVVTPLLLPAANLDPLLHEAYFKASNTEPGDRFGQAVAVSGDIAVVGAPWEDSVARGVNGDDTDNSAEGAGAAYVFVREDGRWKLEAYLKASNPDAGDDFGWSVAVSGTTIVVGAGREDSMPGDPEDNHSPEAGAAYVFFRDGDKWVEQAMLKASNAEEGDHFGWSVAISGDTILVGADGERSKATGVNGNEADNSASAAGAAYVFVRSGSTWSQQAYLKASNTEAYDAFGYAVALSGDTAVVGARLEDSLSTGVNGAEDDNTGLSAGAAYVFQRDAASWAQQAYLKASNSGVEDRFGSSVSVSGDLIVVGAHEEDSSSTRINENGNSDSMSNAGAAYVFTRSGVSWLPEAYLKAPNTDMGDYFGYSVAVVGDLVAIGAPSESSAAVGTGGNMEDDSSHLSGAVYLFGRAGGTWSFRRYLKAPTNDIGDWYGAALALDYGLLLAAAPAEDSRATFVNGDQTNDGADGAGAAHVYSAYPDLIVSIMKTGQALGAESPGVVASFGSVSLNHEGKVMFDTTLSGYGTAGGKNRAMMGTLAGNLDTVMRSQWDISQFGVDYIGTRVGSLFAPMQESGSFGLFQATIVGADVTAANNRIVVCDTGTGLTPLVRTDRRESTLGWAKISSIGEVLQHPTQNLWVMNYKLKPEAFLWVDATRDSGLHFLDHAGTRLGIPSNLREGSLAFAGGRLGQFFGRAAFTPSGDAHFGAYFYFDDTITYGGRPAQALFFSSADNLSHWRTVIQGQIPGETWGVMFQSFLGETSSGSDLLVRATLTGRGATAATNEGIWRGFGGEMWLRKGSDIGGGLFVKRILQFWPVSTDQMVVLAQIGGPGVTLANNTALLLRQANAQYLTLMRTGTAAQGVAAPGLVAAIQRVDVDAGSGHYAVQASLKGVTAATNQGLWMGNTQVGDDGVNQVHRLPRLVVRKGDTYSTAATNNGTILGLDMKTATNPGGAGSRGQFQTIGGGRVVLILLTNGSKKELVIIDRMTGGQ